MKYILPFFLILHLLSSTNVPQGNVSIYVQDMRNHEDFRFRIIHLVDPKKDNTWPISRDINLDLPENQALADEISKITSVHNSNEQEIIGRDIALIFPSDEIEQVILQEVEYASHCYIYYLKGHFVKKNKFYVEQYHLIPASPKCINNYNNNVQVK